MACKNDAPNIKEAKYVGALMIDVGFQDEIKKRVHLLSLLQANPACINLVKVEQEQIVLTNEVGEQVTIAKDDLFELPDNEILIKVYPQVISAVDQEINELTDYVVSNKTAPLNFKKRQLVQVSKLVGINAKLKKAQANQQNGVYLPMTEAVRLSLTVSYINNLQSLAAREEQQAEKRPLYEWNKLYAGLTSGELEEENFEDEKQNPSIEIKPYLKNIRDYNEPLYQQLNKLQLDV